MKARWSARNVVHGSGACQRAANVRPRRATEQREGLPEQSSGGGCFRGLTITIRYPIMRCTILAVTVAVAGALALTGAVFAAENNTNPSAPGHSSDQSTKSDTRGSTGSIKAGSKGASGGPSTGMPGSATDKPMGSDATGSSSGSSR